MNEVGRNAAELDGTALSAPVFSHENHGIRFYRFELQIPRLSGQADLLPVLAPEGLAEQVRPGARLHVQGQLRSFNNKSGRGSRLVLNVYAHAFAPSIGDAVNRVFLSGILCKPPVVRRTPLGRNICDLMLAVPRRYGRADYLPAIAWGQLAAAAGRAAVGDPIRLEGRMQSRLYTKVSDGVAEEHTAYEVSVMRLLDADEESSSS